MSLISSFVAGNRKNGMEKTKIVKSPDVFLRLLSSLKNKGLFWGQEVGNVSRIDLYMCGDTKVPLFDMFFSCY